MKVNKIFGIISLISAAAAFVAGLAAVMSKNLKAGAVYFLIISAAPAVMVNFFCRRCPCAEKGCGHVLPGMIAAKIGLKQGGYSNADLGMTAAAIAALVAFPQPWLVRRPKLLALFWMLLLAALYQIRVFVCRYCENGNCPSYTGKTPE